VFARGAMPPPLLHARASAAHAIQPTAARRPPPIRQDLAPTTTVLVTRLIAPASLPRAPSCTARCARIRYRPRPMQPVISISKLTKAYESGLVALKSVDLEIHKGEIFALLGPNGAGKTTLISAVCGILTPSSGAVLVDGHDIIRDYRAARSKIGLVPQELTTDAFETPWATVTFSRGLWGRPPDPAHVEKVLRDLSLWDKRRDKIMTLSGGMKRRVMIAKALAHEPEILFLDEPTAGVDVELRRDMWALVRRLREGGVTIILTTHYIDEAEEMADRIGIIAKGELILTEEKTSLMRKLGKRQLTLQLQEPMTAIPPELASWALTLKGKGSELELTFDANDEHSAIPALLRRMQDLGVGFKDLNTRQSSLEEIFVSLIHERVTEAR
jgi:ABC-2 type transport system ATP-binding protein